MTNKEAIAYLIPPIATSTEPSAEYLKQKEAYDLAIKALEERSQSEWVSVSERLPEPQKPNKDIYNEHWSDFVLVCIEWWNGKKVMDTAFYDFDEGEWVYHGDNESEVIAWQPLPEPYEKGRAEE